MNGKTKNILTVAGVCALVAACVAALTLTVMALSSSGESGEVSLYSLYTDSVAAGEYDGTFEQWLADNGYTDATEWSSTENSYSTAINSSLLSAVSITAYGYYTTTETYMGKSEEVTYAVTSSGSGVFIDVDRDEGDAYFLTNCHVIYDGAFTDSGYTYTPTGSLTYTAYLYGLEYDEYAVSFSVVGASVTNDVALCRVEDSDVIRNSYATAATVGDSDTVAVGDRCYLIGNALGEGIAASSGVVSVQREDVEVTAADGETTVSVQAIRTDAAAYSGNSGGGLFNASGELIGLLFAGDSDGGGNLSDCLPINTVMAVADSIYDNCDGTTQTTTLFDAGFTYSVAEVSQSYDGTDLTVEEQYAVDSVESGSAADGAGMQEGDIILSMTGADGSTVQASYSWSISDFLWTVRAGDTFTVTVERDGEQKVLTFEADADSFADVE